MVSENSEKSVGFLFKRKDLYKLSINQLKQEIMIHLFELEILKQAIKSGLDKKFNLFDASIGDWKCQTRASMIIDKFGLEQNSVQKILQHDLFEAEKVSQALTLYHQNLSCYNSMQCQKYSREELEILSLYDLFNANNCIVTFDPFSIFLGLSFFTDIKNNYFHFSKQFEISQNKIKILFNKAKYIMCYLSIDYEKHLATKYATKENVQFLDQIEFKGMQRMTSLFAGFLPMYKKMIQEQQPFFISFKHFCPDCYGLKKLEHLLWSPAKNSFENKDSVDHQMAINIIDAYQYQGSLKQLQKGLEVPETATDIPVQHLKTCYCAASSDFPLIENFEEAIMAFFAQHPQFTNGAPIDWEKLRLQNSDIQKEYDYLLTLKGFSCLDMSIFHINHMYASTIAEVLEADAKIIDAIKNKK